MPPKSGKAGTYETRAVLAGAYKARIKTTHTHAVELGPFFGNDTLVLCGKVELDSLADPCASDVNARPTCQICAKRDPRFQSPATKADRRGT